MDLNPSELTRLRGGAWGAPRAMRSPSQPRDAKAGCAFGSLTDLGSNSVPSCVTLGRFLNLTGTEPSPCERSV